MSAIDADPRSRFSPDLQDRLADELLIEAGLMSMQRGEMTRRSFMYRLAKIWAGLPLPSGESYYEGYAGNKATMTWARFDGAMAQIFPG
jgi:muramidase (phage lysozyme)